MAPNEPISYKPERPRVAGALKAALYTESKDLRPPEEAAVAFETACQSVDRNNSISAASLEKWSGTVEANAQLIRDGCLHMNGSNTYEENNEKVKLLHTSGLESTNALLKKLSNRQMGPELALRLLSFFVIKPNHDCGIKFSRIPSIHNFDILTVLQHTLVTREYIPDIPDTTEYALQIIRRLKQGMGLKNLQPTAVL
ncbi:hypothetical protein DFS34DRAFT_691371 [Phlyctochytrium arcticum]|nr:hypothetical protein DFS34DRAFT_691371 [Phlyctochytrium arcticum]